jgi:hypothetical protein
VRLRLPTEREQVVSAARELKRKVDDEKGSMPAGSSYIYFVQALHGGPIKIGRAADPIARLGELQVGNPHRLRVCHLGIGRPTDELRMHYLFGQLRLVGEWFRPHPTLANLAHAIPDESLVGERLVYPKKLPDYLQVEVEWDALDDETRFRVISEVVDLAARRREEAIREWDNRPPPLVPGHQGYEAITALPRDANPDWRGRRPRAA